MQSPFDDAGYIANIRQDPEQAKNLVQAAITQSGRYYAKAHEKLKQLLRQHSRPRDVRASIAPNDCLRNYEFSALFDPL